MLLRAGIQPASARMAISRSHAVRATGATNAVRFKSTVEAPAASSASEGPTLQHVRSFPLVGSIIPAISGVPNSIEKAFEFWPEVRKRHGDFYTIGIPSVGNPDDLYRTVYMITDPREMIKVVRAGGAFPSGLVESLWVSKKWNETRRMQTSGLLDRGEEWKRIRSFMQTDLMQPEAARGYVPGMVEAARLASSGAPASADDLNTYLGRCAFDLFSTIMFGELTNVSDKNTYTDPENETFVTSAADGLGSSIEMLFSPYEMIMGTQLGITTKKCQFAFTNFDTCWEIAQAKIERFSKRKEEDHLSENEQASYLARALDRQLEDGSNVSVREVHELAFTGLFAAVDTTSSVLGWNLFNVSRCEEVQEKLHKELAKAVEDVGEDGKLTAEALSRKQAPYLHATIRETMRLTPPGAISTNKRIYQDGVVLHGVPMKQGDVVALEGYTTGMDPALVEDPEEFRPERWFSDAVEARKGTKKEIIDHPFFKDPFSQGARKCPGSRVATNEIQVMMAQLALDWKMTNPIKDVKDCTYHQKTTLEVELPKIEFERR